MKPSDLLSALLAPAGEPQLPHAAYVGLEALLDALPIALMEFRLSGESLVLLTANAAARRMPGLGGCVSRVPMPAPCSTNSPARR